MTDPQEFPPPTTAARDERGAAPEDPVHTALVRVLGEIQRRGAIGRGPIEAAIEHAEQFVGALPHDLPAGVALVDLGSGGGLPGLVIVARRPDLRVTLVERRAKRADLLRFGARALDATDRVDVFADDVEQVIRRSPGSFTVVTARSFAAPEVVADVAGRLLDRPGWLLVAEPPETRTWPSAALAASELVDDGRIGSIHRFRRS
jgi:16S rRNA (guanine527-N7)-methyltransferase